MSRAGLEPTSPWLLVRRVSIAPSGFTMLATQRVNEVHMNSREFSPGGPNYAILCFLCAKHALLPPLTSLLCSSHDLRYRSRPAGNCI